MNEKIIEGNRLIAEFMGLSYCNKYQYEGWYQNSEHNYRICDFDSLKYHSSWDWLMPVVEKIENIVGCYTPNILIQYHCCMIEDENKEGLFKFQNSNDCKILAVWLSVIEFIKWYNKNKQL